MLENDRDLYFRFAQAMGLDFRYVCRIVDGEINAGPNLATCLGHETYSSPKVWTRDNMAPVRLVAVKAWEMKQRRGVRRPNPALLPLGAMLQ